MSKRDLYLSADSYRRALLRQRTRIAGGLPLVAEDDDTPGNKSTHATWGLCSNELAAWPDPADHLFENSVRGKTVYGVKYLNAPHKCPFDGRKGEHGAMGCFFQCMIFQRRAKRPNREQAVALYDAAIAKATGGDA